MLDSSGLYHSLSDECSSLLYHQRFSPVSTADSINTVHRKYSRYLFIDLWIWYLYLFISILNCIDLKIIIKFIVRSRCSRSLLFYGGKLGPSLFRVQRDLGVTASVDCTTYNQFILQYSSFPKVQDLHSHLIVMLQDNYYLFRHCFLKYYNK